MAHSKDILSPAAAGALYLGSGELKFRVFCGLCGGWVVWQEGMVECAGCGQPNEEAVALNTGVRQARLNLAPAEIIKEGKA